MVKEGHKGKRTILSTTAVYATVFLCAILCTTLVYAADMMVIEADILDGGTPSNETGTISIQVPEFIDLGETDEDGSSDELKIYMNNTGSVDITVTPQLIDYSDDIFDHLYFREFKTSGGLPVEPRQIGDWSFNVSAPTGGSTFRAKYFYMQLDLSESGVDVSSDLRGHRANVRFVATAR